MTISLKNKMYLSIGITTIVAIVVWFLLIDPFIIKVKSLNNDIYDSRVALEIIQKEKTQTDILERDYKKIQEDTKKISQVFIFRERTLDFISLLENIASENQLSQEISLEELSKPDEEIKKLTLQLNLKGDFINLIKYINKIESTDYYIDINTLNFSRQDNNVSLNIIAQTYWK